MADEELATSAIRVGGAGHREHTLSVGAIIKLGLDLIARATGAGLALGTELRVGAAALNHEALDNAVKAGAVVETFAGQLEEIFDRAGGDVGPELDGHVTVGGVDDGARCGLRIGGFFHIGGRGFGGVGEGEAQ